MAVKVGWVDEEAKILCFEYIGAWTWDEIYKAVTDAERWTTSHLAGIYVIHDFTNGQGIPRDALLHGQRLAGDLADDALVVIVGSGTLGRFMLDILRRLSPSFKEKYQTAATVHEAVALIQQYRQ